MTRYEDNNSNISYIGTGWTTNNGVSAYSGNNRHICENTSINPKIKFNFIGSKIYLISSIYPTYSSDIQIKIDNYAIESFSQAFGNVPGKCICYIKNNLSFREHSVEITKITAGTYSVDFTLDAVDIDSDGSLLPYNSDLIFNKYLIQDGNNLCKTDDRVGLTVYDSLPYTKNKFDNYGMDNLFNINPSIIDKIINDKFNIAILK